MLKGSLNGGLAKLSWHSQETEISGLFAVYIKLIYKVNLKYRTFTFSDPEAQSRIQGMVKVGPSSLDEILSF